MNKVKRWAMCVYFGAFLGPLLTYGGRHISWSWLPVLEGVGKIWLLLALTATLLTIGIELVFWKREETLVRKDGVFVEEAGPKSYAYLVAGFILIVLQASLVMIYLPSNPPG